MFKETQRALDTLQFVKAYVRPRYGSSGFPFEKCRYLTVLSSTALTGDPQAASPEDVCVPSAFPYLAHARQLGVGVNYPLRGTTDRLAPKERQNSFYNGNLNLLAASCYLP